MFLYVYFEDSEGRRNPAFDADIHLHHTPGTPEGVCDLDRLHDWSEEAAEERPHLTYVIVDLDHEPDPDNPFDTGGVIDVFGRLLREQDEAGEANTDEIRMRKPGPTDPRPRGPSGSGV